MAEGEGREVWIRKNNTGVWLEHEENEALFPILEIKIVFSSEMFIPLLPVL